MNSSTLRSCLFLILIILLGACAPVRQTKPETISIEIDGVVIRNQLTFPVTDVQLLVLSSGNFVGCGNIMSRSACSTTFPLRDYSASKVLVTWKEYGKEHSTGEFVIKIPDEIDRSKPAQLEVIIFMMGEAGAKLVQ